MKEKGLSLIELLISITILSIVLVILSNVWLSIQRDTFIQRIDFELERGVSLAISNLRSDILKAVTIYTPGVSITINDNSGSKYSVGTYSFVTNTQNLVIIVPKDNNIYRFKIYITRQRTGALYDSLNPNACMLLYYSKELSWTPIYSQGNITNLVKNFTFTAGESPRLLIDYLANNGLIIKYIYLDVIPGHSDIYTFYELTSSNYTPGKKVQLLEITIKAQKRWTNLQRERTATITLSPFTF